MPKDALQPQDKYVLRLPDGMRDRLKNAAANAKRSLNAEMIARLEKSFWDEQAFEMVANDLERTRKERDKAYAELAGREAPGEKSPLRSVLARLDEIAAAAAEQAEDLRKERQWYWHLLEQAVEGRMTDNMKELLEPLFPERLERRRVQHSAKRAAEDNSENES